MQLARSVSTVLSQHFYFSTCTHEATTQRLVQNSNLQEPLDGTLSAVAVPHQAGMDTWLARKIRELGEPLGGRIWSSGAFRLAFGTKCVLSRYKLLRTTDEAEKQAMLRSCCTFLTTANKKILAGQTLSPSVAKYPLKLGMLFGLST